MSETPSGEPAVDDADLLALATVTAQLTTNFEQIDEMSWSLPTPCEGWDLQTLVDHVVGGNWFTLFVLAGRSAEDSIELAFERFEGGSATVERAAASCGDQLNSFHRPGVLDDRWSHITGELTGREILRIRLHDLIVHSWDVSKSLSTSAMVPDALAQWGLAELQRADSRAAELFGVPASQASRGSSPAVSYLKRFGRHV